MADRGARNGGDLITVFDGETGARVHDLAGHKGRVHAVAFSNDGGTLVSVGEDNAIRFWDLATRKTTRTVSIDGHRLSGVMDQPGEPAKMLGVVLAPDLSIAVTSGEFDDRLLVWDLKSGRLRRTFDVGAYFYGSMAISPDGRLLAAAMTPIAGEKISIKDPESRMEFREASIAIWDIKTKRVRMRLEPKVRSVESLAFSADGRMLVSGMSDTTAVVWDVAGAYLGGDVVP
jgi:WD40 repeat protein